jgi:acetyl-CoA synthetase
VPDDVKGEAIVVYVVTKPGFEVEAPAVAATMVDVLGPTFRPREVHVVPELPKTQSGKIVRRLIRQKYLGEPLSALSTVASAGSGLMVPLNRRSSQPAPLLRRSDFDEFE